MDVFDLVAKIRLDSSEYEQGVGKAKGTFSTLASGVKTGLATVAKVGAAAVTAGVAGVTALTKMGVEGYKQYEQLAGGAELLWGDAYKFIAEKAKGAYATVQMSQNDYLQQVNGFAVGLKTALGGNEQAAAELANRIITAEADIVAATGNTQENVQNAFNGIMKSNFSMVDNLGLGITATKEGFQTMIDSVNKYNKEHGKATKYQIDNVADCQAALLDYIEMQGMSGYAGMEAAKTIEGSLSMVKAAWSNLVVGMADENANMETLIGNFVESAAVAAQNLLPRIEQALAGVGELITGLAPVIAEALPQLAETVLPSLLEAGVSLVGSLVAAVPDLVSAIISAVSQFVTEKIPEMFPGLAESISVLKGWFEDIGSYIAESWAPIFEDVSIAFNAAKDAVQPLIEKFVEYVSNGEAAEDATNLLKDAIDFVAEAYQSVKDFINDTVTAFQDACTWVEEHKLGLELLASAIGVVTTALVAYNVAQTIANAGGIAEIATLASTAVGYYALVAAETVATAATSAFGAVMAFVTSPITLVVAAIAAVIAIIVLCVKHWDEITEAVSKAWDFIKEKTQETVDAVVEWFQDLKAKVQEKIEALKQTVSSIFEQIKSNMQQKAQAAKDVVTSIFEGIKSNIQNKIQTAKSIISNTLSLIKAIFTGDFGAAKQSVLNIFDAIKDGIKNKIENAKNTIKNTIDAIKGIFNFSWSLPELKLPHISVSGGTAPYGIGGKGSLPSFSIEWYKKAYDNAMILSKPTIFGYSDGKFLGGGDGNGNEVVAGESYLMGLISQAVESKNDRIAALLSALLEATVGGNAEMVQALMSDRTFAVGEREFARLVKTYA